MNRKEYLSDPRYAKVLEKMDLLGIMDVSTTRQSKNGTIVWKLPIRNSWRNGKFIEVGSFKSGMVRNQNSAYSNYQLNKCKPRAEYFKDYKWVDDKQVFTGKYNKYICKERILIPIEIDRLEYLISYCLKNYYIKHANFVANGDYVTKWKHEWELSKAEEAVMNSYEPEDCGHYKRIKDLENKLEQAKDKYKKLDDFCESSKVFNDSMYEGRNDRVKDLENKLATIQRIADHG